MARFNIDSNINQVTGQFGSFSTLLTGGVRAALTAVRAQFISLGAVIAANPIGAILTVIVIAVGAVGTALSGLQPVVDQINIRLAQLRAAWDFVRDSVAGFLGLGDAPARSFSDTVTAAGDLERANIALVDSENDLIVATAERMAMLSALRLIAADATASDEDRIEALEEARRVTNELFDAESAIATERVRILTEQQGLGNNTREDNTELANLQAMLIGLETQRNGVLMASIAMQSALILRTETLAEQQRLANIATQTAIDLEEQRASDATRETQQSRELDLLEATGASEQELFDARIERAETEEERLAIEHEREVARIQAITDAESEAAATKIVTDAMVASAVMEAEDAGAAATQAAEDAKTNARQAAVGAAIGFITGLLGDSKGAMIAGLLATSVFEGVQIVSSGTAAAATATASAAALSIPTFGASLAALPAVLAGISGSTGAALGTLGVTTGLGIANILATPGAPPNVTGGSGGGGAGVAGPTVNIPLLDSPTSEAQQMQNVMNDTMSQIGTLQAVVSEGSIADASERNARSSSKRTLNRNRNGN